MSDNVLKFKQKVDVFPIAPNMIEDVLETVRPLLRKAQRIVDRDVGLGFIEDELREGIKCFVGCLYWGQIKSGYYDFR
jgi:hypothetical protein